MNDAPLILFAVVVAGVLLGAPIAAFILAYGARTRARNAETALRAVEARLAYVEWWVGYLRPPEISQPEAPAPEAPPPQTPDPQELLSGPSAAAPESASSALHPHPSPKPPGTRKGPDLEGLVGVRIFAWLGGAVLFIAAALFLQYSIEHDLIPPAARVAIGLVAGTLFLLGGDVVRRRADWAGQALSGAGLGTLYASLYAARALYDLLPALPTFAGMALVTLAAGALALRRSAYVLAVIGLLGGFATPLLLSTGDNKPVALFAYVAMLDAGVVVLSYKRRWHSLLLLSLIGSVLLYAGWAARFLDETPSGISLAAGAVLGAIFAMPALLERNGTVAGGTALLRSAAAALGTVAPFFAALAVAATTQLAVAPELLVSYLLLLSLATVVVSARAGLEWLAVASPVLSLVALTARIDDDLFPAHRATTLAWFALPAALTLAESLVVDRRAHRRGGSGPHRVRAVRVAAGLALLAAPILIARIVASEPLGEPIFPLAAFVSLHLLGLVVLAAQPGGAPWLFAADGASVGALLALAARNGAERTSEFATITSFFMIALWAAPLLLGRRRPERLASLSSGVALLVHFPILFAFTHGTWPPAALAAAALGCALLAVATLRAYFRAWPAGEVAGQLGTGTVAILGAIALAFVTASVPIALDNQWITVAWAAEAAALAWLRRRIEHEGLVVGSAALAAAAFIRLVANPWLWEYEATGGFIVINWLLYAFGIPIVSLLAAARWLSGSPLAKRIHLRGAFTAAAGVLAFVLMNAEIADAFAGTVRGGLKWSGDSVLEDMIYSLGWGLFALATLVVGIVRRSRGGRAAALGVLVLTFAKVFLHDLWQLGSLYRVGSMIGLAVALLAVSFLLQRFVLRAGPAEEGTP